jgi:hypothetical protein
VLERPPRLPLLESIERVSIHINGCCGARHVHGHHVETTWSIIQPVPRKKIHCHFCNAALLPRRDRLGAIAESVPGARFDLDEHGHIAVAGDDVDFAIAGAVAAFENCVPALEQFCAGDVFANDSEQMPFVSGHDPLK